MAWPKSKGRRQNCPPGWIHVPHIFFETYWNTPLFDGRWTPGADIPWVLSNGDATGYSNHADFLAAWDENTLQHIIDTCNAGSSGMDNCAGIQLNDPKIVCTIKSGVDEVVTGVLDKLPGTNPITGWKYGTPSGGGTAPPAYNPAPVPDAPAPAPAPPKEDPKPAPPPPKNEAPAPSPIIETPKAAAAPPATTQPPPAANNSPKPDACSVKVETVWETVTVYGDAPKPTGTANATGATVAGFKYAGCFKDASDRALSGDIRPGGLGQMTNEKCIKHCKTAGFALAGTEYGGQCYCGNELVGSAKLEESSCTIKCEGDASQICGGGWALSVYSIDGQAALKSTKMRRHVHKHANHALRHRSARK
jgi:hypothetical protein